MEFKNQTEHRAALANTFLEMFKHQSNCDVSLVIAGRMMKAHKRILSTFSTFFKEIFDELEANSSIATNLGANVAFLNYKYEHVEVLIKYMYTGVIRVNREEWPAVLKCATDLGITAIIEYGRQHSAVTSDTSGDNKRKLDENKSNLTDTKRSKNDAPPKESTTEMKRKESTSNGKQREKTTAEDILSGVSFDHSQKSEKPSSSSSASVCNTQITKVTKPPTRISETSKGSNSKSDAVKPNESKKDINSSSSQKLFPSATSTPKSNHHASDAFKAKSSRPLSDDSDSSLEYSPFTKTKQFGDKLKEFDSMVNSNTKSAKKDKEEIRPDSTSVTRKDETSSSSAKVPTTVTCSKCNKSFVEGTHFKDSDLPTPPAMCPITGCEKMMKMNRMLKDHLTKFHKVSLCEEK